MKIISVDKKIDVLGRDFKGFHIFQSANHHNTGGVILLLPIPRCSHADASLWRLDTSPLRSVWRWKWRCVTAKFTTTDTCCPSLVNGVWWETLAQEVILWHPDKFCLLPRSHCRISHYYTFLLKGNYSFLKTSDLIPYVRSFDRWGSGCWDPPQSLSVGNCTLSFNDAKLFFFLYI